MSANSDLLAAAKAAGWTVGGNVPLGNCHGHNYVRGRHFGTHWCHAGEGCNGAAS